jgi:hypothetical protein
MVKWQSSLRKYLPKSGYKRDMVHKSLINLLLYPMVYTNILRTNYRNLVIFSISFSHFWLLKLSKSHFIFLLFLSFFLAKLCQLNKIRLFDNFLLKGKFFIFYFQVRNHPYEAEFFL